MEWISIDKLLPNDMDEVLVVTNTSAGIVQCIYVEKYFTERVKWHDVFVGIDKGLYQKSIVKYWMPLPSAPEPPKQ